MILNQYNICEDYNFCEDWGWYVDIENNNHILPTNLNFISHKPIINPYKKLNYHYNKLEVNKYNYKKNYKDNKEIKLNNLFKKQFEDKKLKDGENFLYKICSTVLITYLLIYVIFFLI